MTGVSGLATALAVGLVTALAVALATAAAGCGAAAPAAGGRASHHASSAPTSPCGASSAATAPAPAGVPALGAVQFVSASAGWVAGSGRILHTADRGRHWATQFRTSPAAGLGALDFTDASHGWAVGTSTVLATADGGAHWRALPEPCPPVRAVHFVSPADGFAVAGGNLPYLGVSSPPPAGGVLVRTADGGRHWQRMAAPADAQTVCFTDTRRGWLGAGGSIYGTENGGRSWTLAVRGPGQPGGRPDTHAVAEVACAGSGAGWAELNGPGAAMSHVPQIGYHTWGRAWQPIFAEQYSASPGLRARVRAAAPGVYPGPFSAISAVQAVFVGWCPACSAPASPRMLGPAPMDVALNGGAVLVRRGRIGQLSQATGAAFVTASDGWVVGIRQASRGMAAIMHTADGGRTWRVQYTLGG